ncbi:efflux RND transporter permease subunit [Desulfatirhabdium butyrativorans]|uniref:efflux RND transporter permease subunit n=1 Tax=Desulfatirhabdium butyrativorans TaxID=340467 RepID=UPI000411D1F9|nr:efflux RND transporter permease subunit [Desulfatirhabdium butyrativorans]
MNSRWIQAHRRSILFLMALLAIAGVGSSFKLPVTLFPNVDFPRIVVSLDAGDRPAEQMALQVTRPVEEAVRRVPGLVDVRSTTSRGSAEISINMNWGADMAAATLQVNAAVTQVLPRLPKDTAFVTRRMDPTVFPIIAYSLTSSKFSPVELRDLAQYQLRPLLSGVAGVSQVDVSGGAREEYRITVDPARLQAYGLALNDVAGALGAANVIMAVGKLEDHYKLYLVVSDTRFETLEQIRQTILKSGVNGVVRLEDVATVDTATVPQWIRITADGRDAVMVQVYQQPGANSVQIAAEIRAKLESFRRQMPKGVIIANWYDQSRLVVASAASVRDAILIGVVLAMIVLLIFLRNLKITLIAMIIVPAVLAATVVMLYALGMSFNIMTLGGMAAAVGLIIDDAIVMVEHITRRLRGGKGPHHGRVMEAAREFFQPLSGSSAATLIVFVPLAFLSGVTGAFFKALSLTMGSALLISFLMTWLAVPILADHLLSRKDAEQKEGGRLTAWLHERYHLLMERLLAHPSLALILIVPLLASGWLAFRHVGSGFMPAMDEGGFILDYRSEPGTALSETDRLVRQVEEIVRSVADVDTYSRRTGTGLGGGLSEANEGDFFIRLKPMPRRPIEQVMDDIRNRVEEKVPGLHIGMAQLMEDLIGDLTAVPQPIEIKIFSDNAAKLQDTARRIARNIRSIPGVIEIRDGINPAGDALVVHVNRTRAALEGVDPEAITRLLQAYISGMITTEVQSGVKMVGVRLWIPEGLRTTDRDLKHLQLRAPDGHLFPLRRVAKIEALSGEPQISRENLKRMVAVTARISGRDMGSVIRDVKRMLDQPGILPAGMYYDLGGVYQQQQIAFKGLQAVFAAAVALVFLLLLFLYENFRVVLSIMSIPLMAVSAVFIGLWATGIELNISAIMGMTMIVGIVTEVAIFYFSEYRELVRHEPHRAALIDAGKNRMRPIAMTTFAAILTLLPLAYAIGQGSAMQQPLAIAIISGLVVQLPLVLLVMPVVYDLLTGRSGKWALSGDIPEDPLPETQGCCGEGGEPMTETGGGKPVNIPQEPRCSE